MNPIDLLLQDMQNRPGVWFMIGYSAAVATLYWILYRFTSIPLPHELEEYAVER